MKSRERMGSIALFEKMKCIFSITPVCRLPGPPRVRHRTIGTGRWPVHPVVRVRCEVHFADLSGCESGEHRTLRVRPVACVR